MTDRELEGRLRAWYRTQVGDDEAAPLELRRDVAAIPRTASRPARRFGRGRRLMFLAAAALLLAGGAAAGSSLLRLTSVVPEPAPSQAVVSVPSPADESPSPMITPSPTPLHTPRPGGLIAFIRSTDKVGGRCYDPSPRCPTPRVWIVGSDGTGAHELFPDGQGSQSYAEWSPDGSRLVYGDDGRLYVTDASGSEPQPVDTGCVAPCERDDDASFSSDGRRVVFVRASTDASGYSGPTAIATMDLDSGRVVVLSSTSPAGGMHPGWSPDGTQIVFWRGGDKDMGGPIAPTLPGVYLVDADGRNLHRVSPTTLAAELASWSPDGARIVLTSADGQAHDIYTIRPDGTDLRRLTTDGISSRASWTPDGRILFVRGSSGTVDGATDFWTMDADGTDAARLIRGMLAGDEDLGWTRGPVWQPVGGPAIVPPPWAPTAATPVGPPPPTPPATPPPALATGFSWTGSMQPPEGDLATETATLLADGRVLVTMGCSTLAQLYDASTGTFSPTGSLTAKRGGKTATLLRDGRVLITGGGSCVDSGPDAIWASAELYDPTTGTFSATGSMRTPRADHTATLLSDGRVLISGGQGTEGEGSGAIVLASYQTVATAANVLRSAELYDPATGTFSETGSMRYFRDSFTATLLRDGRVLVVGGGGEGYASRTEAELYDPATGTFSQTGSLQHGRWLHTATLLGDGRVLIAGGRSPRDSTYASAELYDPATGTFGPAGSMKGGRQQHTATLLADGRVLIAGGYQSDGQRWDVLSSTVLFDPATGTFSAAGSMGDARMEQVATLIDGRVLIAGGTGIGTTGLVALTSAVLYEPQP